MQRPRARTLGPGVTWLGRSVERVDADARLVHLEGGDVPYEGVLTAMDFFDHAAGAQIIFI